MSAQLIPVFSALIGVLLGGILNFFTTKSVKQQEWKLTLVKDRINFQTKLFSDFILCTQRMLMQSMEKKISNPTELNQMNDYFSLIELSATDNVVDASKQICDYILANNLADPKEETRNFYTLKQDFIRFARTELRELEL
jgi:hypothetical protein